METDEWRVYRFRSPEFKKIAIKYKITDNDRIPYEKGSYEFTRGLICGVFDPHCYTAEQKGLCLNIGQLTRLSPTRTSVASAAIQRMLFNVGIYTRNYNNEISIPYEEDITKYLLNIGFSINEKQEMAVNYITQHSGLWHKSRFMTSIREICSKTEYCIDTYEMSVDGDLVSVNCILARC